MVIANVHDTERQVQSEAWMCSNVRPDAFCWDAEVLMLCSCGKLAQFYNRHTEESFHFVSVWKELKLWTLYVFSLSCLSFLLRSLSSSIFNLRHEISSSSGHLSTAVVVCCVKVILISTKHSTLCCMDETIFSNQVRVPQGRASALLTIIPENFMIKY